jgi:O-antigen ligase
MATGIPENVNQDSLTGRIGIWQIALEIYQSSPMIGLGSNYASNEIARGIFPLGANSAHSLYLDALVTGGPLLLWSVVTLVGRVVTNANHGINMQLFGISIALAGFTETIWTFYSFNAVNLFFAYLMSEKSKVYK